MIHTVTDENREEQITTLRNHLRTGNATIMFTKVSTGEDREMWCTLDLGQIPEEDHPSTERNTPDGLMVVYDLENGWRSFRTENLQWWKAE